MYVLYSVLSALLLIIDRNYMYEYLAIDLTAT